MQLDALLMLRLLLALLAAQAGSWWLARLLGARLRWEAVGLGLLLPWLLLWPWIAGPVLLAPTQALAGQVPGTVVAAQLDDHARELNDVVYALLPWELEVRKAYGTGRWPFWSHRLDGGSTLWANPQAGVLCPIATAARLLPIQHHHLAALAIKMLIALQGVWVLTRRLGLRRPTALAAGAGFALAGGIMAWGLFTHSTAAAWAPWCAAGALAIARPRRSRAGGRFDGRRAAVIGTALAFAALLLAGQPEVAASAGALSLVTGLSLARRRRRARTVAQLVLAGCLGAGLAAPVVLPFLELLPHSQRAQEHLERTGEDSGGTGWFEEDKGRLLLAPANPHAFGAPFESSSVLWTISISGYAGLAAFLGCALLVVAPGRRRALPFLAFAVVAMLVATEFRPLMRLWYIVPPLRLPETTRFLLIAALGLTVAGAVGLEAITRRLRHRWGIVVVAGVACAASLALAPEWAAIGPWLLLLGAVATAGRRRLAGVLLVAAVLVELVPWARRLLPRGDPALFYPRTPEVAALAAEAPELYRAIGQDYLSYPSLLPFYGLAEPRAINPLLPEDYLATLRAGFGFNPSNDEYFSPVRRLDHPLRRFFGVRAIVSNVYLPAPPAAEAVWSAGQTRIYRDTKALPRLFTTDALEVIEHERLTSWLAQMRDPARVAIFAHEVADWRLPGRFLVAPLEVSRFEANRIEFRLPRRGAKLVATSIPGPRGWSAEGGGRGLRVLTVNGAFLGVVVPRWIENVTLTYRPPGLRDGLIAAAFSLLALLAVAVAPAAWLRPRTLRDALLVAGALWSGVMLAVEFKTRMDRQSVLPSIHSLLPSLWVWGSPPTERVRSLMEAAEPLLPAGRCAVGLVSGWSAGEAVYPHLWAAYFLPRCDVVPIAGADAAGPELRIVIGPLSPESKAVEVAPLPGGGLYRRAP